MNARHPSEASLHVDDHIRALHATANDLRIGRNRQGTCERVGLFVRARLAVGHRLIAVGSVVAGQHA